MPVAIHVEGQGVHGECPWGEIMVPNPRLHFMEIDDNNLPPELGQILTVYYSGIISLGWHDHYVWFLDESLRLHNFLMHRKRERDRKLDFFLLAYHMLLRRMSVETLLDPFFQEIGEYLMREITKGDLTTILETIFKGRITPGQDPVMKPVTLGRRKLSEIVHLLDYLSLLLPNPVNFLRVHIDPGIEESKYGLINASVEVLYQDLIIRTPAIFIFPRWVLKVVD